MIIARIGKLKLVGSHAIHAAFADFGQQILGGKISIRLPMQRGQNFLRLAQRDFIGRSRRDDQFVAFQIGQLVMRGMSLLHTSNSRTLW